MRVYKLIRAEAREQMSSQDRPEATAAASAPAREPEPQPNERREASAATNNPNATNAGNAPREAVRRHGRRRHRSAGGGSGGGGISEQRETQTRAGQPERELNLDELRELSELLNAQGFNEFEIEREGFRLRLSKQTFTPMSAPPSGQPFVPPTVTPVAPPQSEQSAVAQSAQTATAAPPPGESNRAATESAAEKLYTITSPIVGTFYRMPSPTAEPFVRQGSQVEADTVVCIIEAMKLMNEIQAEVSGTVEKIYVENGQPVEYGQALFGIKK
jgi:acetyl-CoA carboxylase biotin carboxyl carrier protein